MNGVLKRALQTGDTVQLIYLDGRGKMTQRTVIPREIKNGRLLAYCFLRRERRSFIISNILSAYPARKYHDISV